MFFGHYTFICRFETEASLPLYKGSTFRGVFGHALKAVVCTLKQQECADCLLNKRCLYTQIFEPVLSVEKDYKLKNGTLPNPYVIEPDPSEKKIYFPGDTITWELLLFGQANKSLPYFIYSFNEMGKLGIGKKNNGTRGRFCLEKVFANDQEIYSLESKKLITEDCYKNLKLAINNKDETNQLKITLETPLRLKFNNYLKADLPFHVFVRAVLRRLSSLLDYYGDGEPELDYKSLIQKAENIEITENNLSWLDWERYSGRQKKKMTMGGIVGDIAYKGDLSEFLPLIEFCEKTHIGKQTTFGLGKIKMSLL